MTNFPAQPDSSDKAIQGAQTVLSPLLKNNLMMLAILMLLFVVLFLLHTLTSIFAVLGASLILTYVLMAPVDWLERKLLILMTPLFQRFNKPVPSLRAFSIILVYIALGLILTWGAVDTVPVIVKQLKGFINDLPGYSQKLEDKIRSLSLFSHSDPFLKHLFESSSAPATAGSPALTQAGQTPAGATPMNQVASIVQNYAANTLQYLVNLGAYVVETFVYGLTCLVMAFYFLLDAQSLKKGLIEMLPDKNQEKAAHFLETLHGLFRQFVKTQLILSFFVGSYLLTMFSLLDVKYAVFLSLVFGLTSIVPVIGPWFGLIPILLVVGLSDQSLQLIWLFVTLCTYYVLKEYFLFPRIFKNRFEIHPVVIIITFLVCLQIAGGAGVILAFPLACLIGGIYQYLAEEQEQVQLHAPVG